jgi:hypothetical protein
MLKKSLAKQGRVPEYDKKNQDKHSSAINGRLFRAVKKNKGK